MFRIKLKLGTSKVRFWIMNHGKFGSFGAKIFETFEILESYINFTGVCVAKNGMVYPCRRKINNPSKKPAIISKQTIKNVTNPSSDVVMPMPVQDDIEQQQPIIEQLVEPIFTIVSPNQEYVIGMKHA